MMTSGNSGLDQPRRAIAIAAVLFAMAMVVIDGGVSNVALPTIALSLGISSADSVLVMTAYQIAVVMALLPSASLGERFGYRRAFVTGVGVFAAASLAAASAQSLPWLMAARFVQGLGGAAILALGVALLRFSVSEERLGAAIGWNALTVALSAATGPALGALIISVADWHWLYAVSAPLGFGVLVAARALPFVDPQRDPIDIVSVSLNALAFGSLALAANAAKANAILAIGLLLLGAISFTLLVKRETPKSRPLLPVDLLRSPAFALSVVASVCCFAGQTAGLIALPFYIQHGLQQTPAMAGIYLAAWPLTVAAAAPLAGSLVQRFSTAWICVAGAVLLTAGLAAIATLAFKDEPFLLVLFAVMCGAGFGLFQVANNRNMFLAAPATRSAAAGGMQGTARLTGQTAGALLVAQVLGSMSLSAAPQVAIGIGALLTFAAGVVSLSRAGSA